MGTQMGHNLTPEVFFKGRSMMSMYNLVLLCGIFWKLRDARNEKKNMEFQFFQRVEGIMLQMSNIFEDQEYREVL
jgi:hypothetical protein